MCKFQYLPLCCSLQLMVKLITIMLWCNLCIYNKFGRYNYIFHIYLYIINLVNIIMYMHQHCRTVQPKNLNCLWLHSVIQKTPFCSFCSFDVMASGQCSVLCGVRVCQYRKSKILSSQVFDYIQLFKKHHCANFVLSKNIHNCYKTWFLYMSLLRSEMPPALLRTSRIRKSALKS